MRLEVGDTAPDFTLPDADGHPVTLGALGRKAVIYFYPAALTPGCTTEACDFRDAHLSLQDAGFLILGISPDSPEKLQEFREIHALTFPLLSDLDKSVHEAYGAWGERQMYGRTSIGVIRSTVVVDAHRRITHALYGHKAAGHVQRLTRELDISSTP